MFLLIFVVLVTGTSGFAYAVWQAVELPPDTPPLKQTTFICSGEVQADCNERNSIAQLSAEEDRVAVKFDQMPSVLAQAVVAAEDKEFFAHKGVDPAGVTRAFIANLRDEPLRQGGSTITQQYVKNTYLTSEQSIERKMREAVLAIKLERELPKKDILERYLNTIYFGRGAYGVQSAARIYFGKDVGQLGLPEAAYLAGIIRAPEGADANRPATDPLAASGRQAAEQRRRDVLRQMREQNYINEAQYDAVDKMGWDYVLPRTKANNLGNLKYTELGSEYFVEYVRRQLTDPNGPYKFSDAQVFEGGLRIYTTIDWNMQKAAYDAIDSTLNLPTDPAASIVALDTSGRVKVMVGGKDFKASQVNLAAGTEGGGGGRQPGSSFKPIALAQALSQGVPLNQTFDAPGVTTLKLKDGSSWRVGNYGDAGLGTLDMVEMTKKSSNTAYAQLIDMIGTQPVVDLAAKMGIKSKLPNVPSMVLGTGDVSPLEMASAFSTFMDKGEHVEPMVVTKVEDSKGQVIYEARNQRTKVLDPAVNEAVSWVLNQVVEGGTGTAAKFGQPVAGKTGTTENYRDAWFNGFTCQLTASVWVGYPGPETKYMDNVHGKQVAGGTFPAEIFSKFMGRATFGLQGCPFPPPLASLTLRPASPVVPFPNFGTPAPAGPPAPAANRSTTTARPAPAGPTTTAAPSTTKPPSPSSTAAPTSTAATSIPP
ncbi:MAG: transglycosylase domain-containing protein [Actinobacteria bacterium]|nr:transglycosylase domain-containing protein [Actinomycetota bacterium]